MRINTKSLSVGSDSTPCLLTHVTLSPGLIFLSLCVYGGACESHLPCLAGKDHLKIEAGEALRKRRSPAFPTTPRLVDFLFQFSALL